MRTLLYRHQRDAFQGSGQGIGARDALGKRCLCARRSTMTPKARLIARLLLAVLATALTASLASAQPVTLFSDDFGPKPLGGWTASPLGLAANWDASSGAAAYNGGGHTQLWAGSAAWTDYRYEAKFKLAAAHDYPGGIRGRVDLNTG